MGENTNSIHLQLSEELQRAVGEMQQKFFAGKSRSEIYELLLWRGLERTEVLKNEREKGHGECI